VRLLLAHALGLICSKDSRCQLDARFFAVQPLMFLNSLPAPSVSKTLEVCTDIFDSNVSSCRSAIDFREIATCGSEVLIWSGYVNLQLFTAWTRFSQSV
jgi:hypothetical protein